MLATTRELLSLSQVANAVGASPAYLTDPLHKRSQGMSIFGPDPPATGEALGRLPMPTTSPSSRLDLGFSSHSHFSSTFRATFGMTPSTTRETTPRKRMAGTAPTGSPRLRPDDDPDGRVRRAWRLRTVEHAAKPAPVRRPVSLGHIEASRAQSLHERGRRLVRCRVTAFLDEHDHAEDPRHARPCPGLRRPAGIAEIGRDRRAHGLSVGYRLDNEHGRLRAGIFPQRRDDRRFRLPLTTCRGRFGRAWRRDRPWRFRRARLGRIRRTRGGRPDELPQIGKSLLDLRRIDLRCL